jgi:hypothetical protein
MALWRSQRNERPEEPQIAFRQCPGCEYDFVEGTGARSCGWYDCPYLPEELKVLCPDCNYNFATGEGSPWCADPPDCGWAAEGRQHAENARRFQGAAALIPHILQSGSSAAAARSSVRWSARPNAARRWLRHPGFR